MREEYLERKLKPLLRCFLEGYANHDVRAVKFVIGKAQSLDDEREHVKRFVSRILQVRSGDIHLNVDHSDGDTSDTVDKQKIYMCVAQDNEVHDSDLLTFVLLHELTHVGSSEHNHEGLFWQQFHFLCDLACNYDCGCNHGAGFDYCTVDFKHNAADYCGM